MGKELLFESDELEISTLDIRNMPKSDVSTPIHFRTVNLSTPIAAPNMRVHTPKVSRQYVIIYTLLGSPAKYRL